MESTCTDEVVATLSLIMLCESVHVDMNAVVIHQCLKLSPPRDVGASCHCSTTASSSVLS